jgi:hypothetical protein
MNVSASDRYRDSRLDPEPDEHPRSNRLRFELIFASLWLAFGLFVLPALIYWIGGALLGSYGDNGSLSRFYIDFFGDLAEPSIRAWLLAVGPVLLISLLRAVFIGVRPTERGEDGEETREEPRRERTARPRPEPRAGRVEPRIGTD